MSTSLIPTWQVGAIHLTEYPYSVDRDNAVEIGEPGMVVESLTSMMADGDIDRVVRHGNRTYVIPCYIEGPDLASVAEAEAALRSELQRPGLVLIHDPGDGPAPASAFYVLTAQMTPERNDTHESHLLRKWTLTLTCEPFARSVEPVVVGAVVGGAYSPVTVDDCSSVTGWAGRVGGVATTPTVASGVLLLSGDRFESVEFMRTGAVDFSSTPYMVVETAGAALWVIFATIDGVERSLPVVSQTAITGGHRLTVDTGGASVTSLRFLTVYHDVGEFGIADVSRSAAMPQVTPRQITRVIATGGTERTPASIHVQSADGTAALDTAIVHTCPEDGSGYSPPLRRWRVSGNAVTTTFDALSGAYEPIHPVAVRAEIPSAALPDGAYLLVARFATDTTGTHDIDWSVSTIASFGSANLVGGTTAATFYIANLWTIVPLAVVTLPTVASRGPETMTRVDILRNSGTAAVINMDEFWLFRVDDDCALTMVGSTPQHLWLDSPDASSPVPRVWWSEDADRANARHPGDALLAMGNHILHPGGTAVFAAAMTDYPAVDATFYRRWHSNAAE